jgi:acyl-CoA-binding protein
MADLVAAFEKAQADSRNLPQRPDNVTLLKIYALYKQATSGDADGERPGFSDLVGRAKWDAWSGISGMEREEAMQQYIDLIDEMKE